MFVCLGVQECMLMSRDVHGLQGCDMCAGNRSHDWETMQFMLRTGRFHPGASARLLHPFLLLE